jgi:hypothetical protein
MVHFRLANTGELEFEEFGEVTDDTYLRPPTRSWTKPFIALVIVQHAQRLMKTGGRLVSTPVTTGSCWPRAI